MIRPLRQRHRVTICALGVLLPIAFTAGIAARKPVPVAATVPSGVAGRPDGFGQLVWTKADLWPGQRAITRLRRDAGGAPAVEVVFRDLTRPDVLLYWAAGNGAVREGLPDNARLLGVVSGRIPIPIPADAQGETGRLVLYSLGDHEVVAISRPFAP